MSGDKLSSAAPEELTVSRLQRHLIVDTALGLLDEVGLDKLSTRLIAKKLDVESPALYWHFTSKRELLDAMAERMEVGVDQPTAPGPNEDVSAWLAEEGRAFRRRLLSRRDGARVHAGTSPPPDGLATLEAKAQALTATGMNTENALRALLAVSRYTLGWVLEEQADRERTHGQAADLPPGLGDYPTLREGASVFQRRNAEANFEYGLNALVDGLTGTRAHTLRQPERSRQKHSRVG